jgi:cyclopropane fatty-acyl-phospholipid synthase-like methyltransferase
MSDVEQMPEDIWDVWNRSDATSKFPQSMVVQFCFRQFGGNMKGLRALDLGCGSGVHTAFLASEGCDVAATDKSPVGISNTRDKLGTLGLNADLKVESADVISFPTNTFDLVICVGILDTVGAVAAAAAVSRLKDVLRPGGKGFFLFSSDRDDSLRDGNRWHFRGYTRSEVDALFAEGFAEVWIDRCNVTYFGGRVAQDEWIVTLRR